jgi:hypothetical protein
MAHTEDISPRATLPGTIYKKNGRWWWRVRLPGQSRIRCRSLRPEGSRVGTRSRRQAGQITLRLWEEALRAEARTSHGKALCEQNQDKAQTHTCKAASSPQQGLSSDATPRANTSDICKQESGLHRLESISSQPQGTVEPPTPNHPAGHLDWLDSLNGIDDHALCECCGQQDFFEEYLHQIASGQRLCPRCYGELKKKAQILATEQLLCT